MKKTIALILALVLVLGSLPLGEMVAYAQAQAVIDGVVVARNYHRGMELDNIQIQIRGKNLDSLGSNPVIVQDIQNNPLELSPILENPWNLFYQVKGAGDGGGIARIFVADEEFQVELKKLPVINKISPSNRIINTTDATEEERTLTIKGSKFQEEGVAKELVLGDRISSLEDYIDNDTTIERSFSPEERAGGVYSLRFREEGANNQAKLTLQSVYYELFRVQDALDVSDDIYVVPTMGPVDSQVNIIGRLLRGGELSLFFTKKIDGVYDFKKENMGEIIDYTAGDGSQDKKDTLRVRVPSSLRQGEYDLVLTNKVDGQAGNIAQQITGLKELRDKFTVIDSSSTVRITELDPSRGPETGLDAVLYGRNIGSIDQLIYSPNENDLIEITGGDQAQGGDELTIIHRHKDNEEGPIGSYNLRNEEEGSGSPVYEIERKIRGYVGNRLGFLEEGELGQGGDRFNIRIRPIDLAEDEPRYKDVTIEVETSYYGKDKQLIRKTSEIAHWDRQFYFEKVNYEPLIEGLVPRLIPVDSQGHIIEGLSLNLWGENFLKYRIDASENIKQPVINLAGQAILDPNIKENSIKEGQVPRYALGPDQIRIYNSQGEEVTGVGDNYLGSKMVIDLPAGIKIEDSAINVDRNLQVYNHSKNDIEVDPDNPDASLANQPPASYSIRFVRPSKELPVITRLEPRLISSQGYQGLRLYGSNFAREAKLYLDGEEITYKRNEIGTELEFDAPAKREGTYQIILQNPDGAIALTSLEYIEGVGDISIRDFNPKMGTAGSLVTVQGSGFLRPVNTKITDIGTDALARRLVGTTVLLGGEDVNDYNLNSQGRIVLEDYSPAQPIFRPGTSGGGPELADFYSSLILKGGAEEYYSIYRDFDTGEIKISDSLEEYIVKSRGQEVYLVRDGAELSLKQEGKTLSLGDRKMTISTPYRISGGKIVGHKLRVINNQELSFIVPPKARNGYYDLTVLNPDTSRDSKTGEEGFLYYFQPQYNPVIEAISPSEGAREGGYFIEIQAKRGQDGRFTGFIDSSSGKTQVSIGALSLDDEDVIVSSDGYSLRARVPAYPGDFPEAVNRIAVNVVVVNPDGGTGSREEGFSYIDSISQPRLLRIMPGEGSAEGGYPVNIEGEDIRLFETFDDKNNNAEYDPGESFRDLNRNGVFDDLRTRRVRVGQWNEETGLYDKDPEDKQLEDLSQEEWDRFVLPLLPQLYFGDQQGQVLDFDLNRLEVEVPRGRPGGTKVYLVNNDYGRSNELDFNYRSSQPIIRALSPSSGTRFGNQTLQILGEDFQESQISIIDSRTSTKNKKIQLVEFGDLGDENTSNQKFQPGEDNSGVIRGRRAQVTVGDLRVEYRADQEKRLDFSLEDGDKTYSYSLEDWNEKRVYLPLGLLEAQGEDGQEENYWGLELVRIELEVLAQGEYTRRLRVDRGFAPEAVNRNSREIVLKTPSYYRSQETDLRLINPDGQEAGRTFTYLNPGTQPKISNITRNQQEPSQEDGLRIVRVPLRGDSSMMIYGRDFVKPVSITIGGEIHIPGDRLEYYPGDDYNPSRIGFKMIDVDESYANRNLSLTLQNPDGGSDTTEDIKIRFTIPESVNLSLEGLVPNTGPTKGGTEVTIHGGGFRESMEGYPGARLRVYFQRGEEIQEVAREDIGHIDNEKIELRTPAFSPGPTDVIVENPDGYSVRLLDGFSYTSDPRIKAVVDPEDEKLAISNISFEGGERIQLKGSDFMEGARLIFNPQLRELGPDEDASNLTGGQLVHINGKNYELKYRQDQEVSGDGLEYIDKENLIATTPPGQLGEKGLLLINPDGGVSNLYNLEYGLPQVDAPFNVVASLEYDEYIHISWNGVRNALEYEIYLSQEGGDFQFIGSTKGTNYIFQDLESDTSYRFMIRALGQYGSSKPLEESISNQVRTGELAGPIDQDGALGQETIIQRQGDQVEVIIGWDDALMKGLDLDLTRGDLMGARDLVIRMPAQLVNRYSGPINIRGRDYYMSFRPYVFRNQALIANRDNRQAGLVYRISTYSGPEAPRDPRLLASQLYKLEAYNQIGDRRSDLHRLAGGIDFNIRQQAPLGLKDTGLSRYYPLEDRWIRTEKVDRMAIYSNIGRRFW